MFVIRELQTYTDTSSQPIHCVLCAHFQQTPHIPHVYTLITISFTWTPTAFARASIPFAWTPLAGCLARHNCWKRGAINIVLDIVLRCLRWRSPLEVLGRCGMWSEV